MKAGNLEDAKTQIKQEIASLYEENRYLLEGNVLSDNERKVILYRYYEDYTQQEIADVLGLSVKQICRYENGEYVPSVISIYILSKLYDISMEWFLTELF